MNKELERKFDKEEFYGWRAKQAMADNYVAICKQACESATTFNIFKSHPHYRTILEHVPYSLGVKYLENVKLKNSNLLDTIEQFVHANDQYGSPQTEYFKEYCKLRMSPTTARYIKVLSDLELLFGDMSGKNIVEIGGGYGGLATVINVKYKAAAYIDIDLEHSARLANKHSKIVGMVNFEAIPPNMVKERLKDLDIDLCISNYSFSECNTETQDFYIENVLKKSKSGYITHNSSKERADETFAKLKGYNNFRIYDLDLCKKQHSIFAWGGNS